MGDLGKSGVRRFERTKFAGFMKLTGTIDLNGPEIRIVAAQFGKGGKNLGGAPMIGLGNDQSGKVLQLGGLVASAPRATFLHVLGEAVGK